MPRATKTLIKNYNNFVTKENAYNIVKQIAQLGKATENSLKTIEKIDKEFAALEAIEKVEVTNYNDFISYKADYQKIMLNELVNRENIIEKDVYINSGENKEIITTVDVDGGTNTVKKTNTITTSGLDGTQYLWIIFTAAGSLLAVIAAVFLIAFIRNKKRRSL